MGRRKNVDALNAKLARALAETVLAPRRCVWCGGQLVPSEYRAGTVLSFVLGQQGVIAEVCAHHLLGIGPYEEQVWLRLFAYLRSEGLQVGLGHSLAIPLDPPFVKGGQK